MNLLPIPTLTLIALLTASALAKPVVTSEELLAAVAAAKLGDVIELAAGTFQLAQPIEVKAGVTLKGAGIGKTILTHTTDWKATTSTLPDPETNQAKFDRSGYLIHLANKAEDIGISGMTLTGPQLHGAIFGSGNQRPHLHDLRIADFMYAGIRTYSMSGGKIHDCVFVDAGQRWQNGQPGVKGGITGGGLFIIWTQDTEIWNNRFLRTKTAPNEHYYGIKGRQAKRCRIHHNTIEVNFSIEFPFENDEDIEIDHNICHGTISIPKHSGGPVPASGRTFHIHHNYLTSSYAIEFVRNGVEIDHNLFDFDPQKDGGNLISGFGKAEAKGSALFHNNLVNNPGRGVIWINEPYSNLVIRNNNVIARRTVTPREEGLFGFNPASDFATIRIADNIIECQGQPRPLLRKAESYAATISNNTLVNVTDTDRYENPKSGAKAGLETPLAFECGVHGELIVNGWETHPAGRK